MDVTLVFVDGESELTIRLTDEGLQVRRPSKGMTPKLQAIADGFSNEDFLGDSAEAEKVSTFINQSKDISVMIGEERCG